MTNSFIRVGLIDGHKLLVDSLQMRMKAAGDMEVVFTSTNAGDGLKAILETKPDVAVLDVDLPGRGTFDIASDLRSRHVPTRILFLTAFASHVLIDQALRLKAHGYLLKSEASLRLFQALRTVRQGRRYLCPAMAPALEDVPKIGRSRESVRRPLTLRQREVLQLLAEGRSMKEVAVTLGMTPRTVAFHKYRVMDQFQLKSTADLVQLAIRERLISTL